MIGSNRTTNEENYLLQKFARTVLGTNNIDHHRTADYPAFLAALGGEGRAASLRSFETAPAMLVIGNDPTEQHPALAWNIRTNVRQNRARLYLINHTEIKLRRQAKAELRIPAHGLRCPARLAGWPGARPGGQLCAGRDGDALPRSPARRAGCRGRLLGPSCAGRDIDALLAFGKALPNVQFAVLGDYVNSRGAADMGVLPDFLPGYTPVAQGGAFAEEYGSAMPTAPGKNLVEMMDAAARGELGALYVVGANPVSRYGVDPAALANTFIVVQDMFLTETAALADVVLPAAYLYEKAGTVTNTYGDIQLVKKASDTAGGAAGLRDDRAPCRQDGRPRTVARAFWQGPACGHGSVARRPVG